MRRSQRYAARVRRSTASDDEPRLVQQKRSAEAQPASPSARIMRLQQTIGNRAVQRLLVQRQPKGGAKQRTPAAVVAKIVLESGEINGGSEIEGHAGEVEFTSLSFQHAIGHTEVGRSRGDDTAASVELEFTRSSDSASTALLRAALEGARIISARFDFVKADENGAVETVFTMEHANGYITSFQIAGSDASGRPYEAGSFSFKKES